MKHKKYALIIGASIAIVGMGVGAFAYASSGLMSVCVKDTGEVRFVIPGYTQNEDCKSGRIVPLGLGGDKGEKGERGERGNPGSSLRVAALDGTNYGFLVSVHDMSTGGEPFYESYLSGAIIKIINPKNAPEYSFPRMLASFTSADCRGEPLLSTPFNTVNNLLDEAFQLESPFVDDNRIFVADEKTAASRTIHSVGIIDGATYGDFCYATEFTEQFTYKLRELKLPPVGQSPVRIDRAQGSEK